MGDDIVMISFSAKELLERVENKLDNALTRLTALEQERQIELAYVRQRSRVRAIRRDIVLAGCTIVMAVGSALGMVHVVH